MKLYVWTAAPGVEQCKWALVHARAGTIINTRNYLKHLGYCTALVKC